MKRVLIASLALAAVTLGGAPSTATGQSAGTDSVIGTASECVESFEPIPGQIICARRPSVDIDVESGPAGENPTGTVVLGSIGLTPGGSVTVTTEATCLSVSGPVAIIGVTGTYRQGGVGFDAHLAGLLRVVDGGGPGSGADTVEVAYRTADISGPPLPGPTTCSTFPGTFAGDPFFFPDFTNETGDVVVTDTRPLPTTKDQCKNGGWRNFPDFKNQGECVSFVVHGATKACLFERVAIGRRAFREKYGMGRFDLFAFLSCVRQRVDG